MSSFVIYDIKSEYLSNPIGLDVICPRFSWKMKSQERGFVQTAYQIKVGSEKGQNDIWDSGLVESNNSVGVIYEGKKLMPCTKYFLTVTVWGKNIEAGENAVYEANDDFVENRESFFETGLLNPSIDAWDGAKWIGAPEKYLTAKTMGVFVLETGITIPDGSSRGGIVFGANDERLMDARKNQYEIEGTNYISYVLDVSTSPAHIDIYRVGYHKDDRSDVPFASFDVPVITEENAHKAHNLKIEVVGDCAYTYMDEIRVDEVEIDTFFGKQKSARPLNPLGHNDVTTFPRLCDIGYYVPDGNTAEFDGIRVKNLRAPGNVVAEIDQEGISITGEEFVIRQISAHSLPMFRCSFDLDPDKKVEKARLYITARGIYDCRINKKAITDTYFNPGASQYDRHIMYQTYDVADLLEEKNAIGVTLASGWWCDSQTYVLKNYNYYGDKESFLAKLTVTYSDGTTDTIVSDTENWQYYGEGPYIYSGFFQGEHVDMGRMEEYENLSDYDFSIKELLSPVEVVPTVIPGEDIGFGSPWPEIDHARTEIVGGVNSPVVEVCRLTAQSMTEPRQGLYIYDLKQEIAGIPYIRLHGKKGTVVTIRYGEMLYPKLPEYGNLHDMMLTENYRDAESIDKVILSGAPEGDVFSPRFSFHGYRYIEISGVDKAPELSDVASIQLSSIPRITGELKTSHELLNRFIENVKWSQLCNFISIPTDCPQRNERMGWAGDTHVFTRTATYQSDSRLFYYRYLQALRDLQALDGKLPDIAPAGGGFGGITYESAMIFMVWELYQQYNDRQVVKEYYSAMSRWMENIKGRGMPGPAFVGPLGDWLALEETDNNLIWNAFYYKDCMIMGKFAELLGLPDDVHKYESAAKETKNYWNDTFIDPSTGKARKLSGEENDTQCAYAIALSYGVLEDKYVEKAKANLVRKTEEVRNKLYTGFFGTGLLNPMLCEAGRADLAYKLMTQTAFPSWLYPVTQGATTIWERWNSYTKENGFGGNNSMNSFNHYSLGSVLSWIYESVLGIKRDEEKPGYEHFTLAPEIMELDFASGGFETNYGKIFSGWERIESEDGEYKYHYHCQIPENTRCTLILPGQAAIELGSGGYDF